MVTATVLVQLLDEHGDLEALLGELNQLIEQGRRIEPFRLLWVDDRSEGT